MAELAEEVGAAPGERIENPSSFDWLMWGVGALVAAMLGAYLIAARMGKPLRQVEDAAKRVGSGETPMPLDESGPQEIAVVLQVAVRAAIGADVFESNRAATLIACTALRPQAIAAIA